MGCICVEPALALRSADAGPSAACIGELVTRLSCRMADPRAQHMPVGRGTANNGAARCAAVALEVPIVAAVSTDIDGNGLYLRRACALPMRYALLPHSSAGTASCRCWGAPIECGPSAACTGELVTRLMCR